jgi:hypothetical protein
MNIMGRLFWMFSIILLIVCCALPAYAMQPKPMKMELSSEGLSEGFFKDFYNYFAPDALLLEPSEYRAAYDILIKAACRIRDGKYREAADVFAVLPDDVETIFRPVITMREDLTKADPIRPFANKDSRGELMLYHTSVWTSHPEFAEDFSAFSEDFALRASRRERDKGAPYIVDKLNDYGFVPMGEGGPQQAYKFLWSKFNDITKFADVCIKLGLDYIDVPLEEYEARVAWALADEIYAAQDEAWAKEGGRQTWSELIEYYTPEEEPVEEELIEKETVEETPEEEILIPAPETTEEIVEYPPEDEIIIPELEETEEIPIEPEIEEAPEEGEALPLEILINPLSLFQPPEDVEIPGTEVPAEPPAEEPTEPIETYEEPTPETVEPYEPVAEEPSEPPAETEEVITPTALPEAMDAVPIPPGEVSGELAYGTPVESTPDLEMAPPPQIDKEQIQIKLASIAESSIDRAGEKGLELGRQAVELAKLLSEDPGRENEETRNQLNKYRNSRSDFLAAIGIVDRYHLEKYLEIEIEEIEEEILAEIRRPYDDLKASVIWEKYREKENDFEDAFARISSDFLNRRTSESIYAGEMAALEARIVEYESVMLEIEELLAAEAAIPEAGEGETPPELEEPSA